MPYIEQNSNTLEIVSALSALSAVKKFNRKGAENAEIESYTFTPNRYPTNAESTIAIVPQIRMRTTAFIILDPPVFADTAPRMMSDRMVKPYRKYSIPATGANRVTNSGKIPPAVNAAPEAIAACIGFA
jgi:hypothetical protein